METLPQMGTIYGALLVSKNYFVSIVPKPLFRDDNRWGTRPINRISLLFSIEPGREIPG
jgi:hypothetical protein